MISPVAKHVAKVATIGALEGLVGEVYSNIRGESDSFQNVISPKVFGYQVSDGDEKVSLYDFAKRRNLETYLSESFAYETNNWRGKMAKSWRALKKAKHGLEKIVETGEVIGTAGPWAVPVQVGSNMYQLPLYLLETKLYNDLGEFFGRSIGAYKPTLKGVYDIYADSAKSNTNALLKTIPVLGSLTTFTQMWDADNRDDRIAQAFAEILYDKVRKKAGEGSRMQLVDSGASDSLRIEPYARQYLNGSDLVAAKSSNYMSTKLAA